MMVDNLWQTVFEQMKVGLALAEGEALLVRQANPFFWNLLGLSSVDRKDYMLLTRLGNDPSGLRWVRSVLSGQSMMTDFKQVLPDNSHRHLEITAHPTARKNLIFVELHDVTQQEYLREELQRVMQNDGQTPKQPAQARQDETRKGILRNFYAITATQSLELPSKFRELLRMGLEILKLDQALLMQPGKEKYIILEAVGQDIRLERYMDLPSDQTYSSEVVKTQKLICFENASVTNWRLAPAYTSSGMEAFIGAPVLVNNEVYCVLSFTSNQPRPVPFSKDDEELVCLLAQWIGSEMERQQQLRQLQSYAEEIRQNNLLLAEARDQALESGRLKSEFLTTISHEIRTPMNGVIGMTNLLLRTQLNTEQMEYLGFIRSSAESLLVLFTELLDYSQLETERARLEEVSFDPVVLQAMVAKQYRDHATSRDLSLTAYAAPDVPRKVRGDAARVEQVLNHLVDNAIKFTQKGAVSMHLTVARKDGPTFWLEYRVTDSGIGISKAVQARLFQPFSQGEGGTTRKFGGMGLGLAICRRQVEIMGGEINVQSVMGKGASFWLKIPLKYSENEDAKNALTEGEELGRLHVLVVSDRPERLLVMCEFLQGWGINVRVMTYGEIFTTLEQALDFDCHMAFMDSPPEGNTHLVSARRLRLKPGLADLPIGLVVDSEQLAGGRSSADSTFQMTLPLPIRQTDLLDMAVKAHQRLTRMTQRQDKVRIDQKNVPAFTMELDSEGDLRSATDQGSLLLALGQPAALRVLSGQLEDLGYQVKGVSSGREVLEALLAEPERYDVVLIGLRLPVINGINTVRMARKTEITRKVKTPLVGLLEVDQITDRREFIEAGLDEVIQLPFDPFEHAALLKNLATPRLKPDPLKGTMTTEKKPALEASFLSSLWNLEKISGQGLVGELFHSYLDNSPKLITQIRQLLNAPESVELTRALHSLKGTSGNLGAHELARICAEMEEAAAKKDDSMLHVLFDQLEEEFMRVRAAMLQQVNA